MSEWAHRLGGEITAEYIDEASGSKANRKELCRLLEDAHKRKFDTLLIWALDRLSREGIAKMLGYLEQLNGYGIRVLSHQEPWLDTSGPIADLLLAIFAWVAQQERERIRERVKAGLERAKLSGKTLGRPQVSFDLPYIQILKSKGKSIRQIAEQLETSPSTIHRRLRLR